MTTSLLPAASMCAANRRAFEMLISAQDAASGAILSPYNGQVKLIRNLLKQSSIKGKVRRDLPAIPCWGDGMK